tara:strand:+ start:1194 stop:2048 length:855 start_codon:yes stop_codon:yes gene_type:complete
MKIIKYFFEFIIIIFFFFIFKVFGLRLSSYISGKIVRFIGPLFRSKEMIKSNINKALPDIKLKEKEEIINSMWTSYGNILSEYMFLRQLRSSKKILIEGENIIEEIKNNNEPVIFISGHFSNFELMAMMIDKFGINLAALYRPLNNFFLNFIMEYLRKKYICKNQIKKGMTGLRELLTYFKNKHSIALMIDQRVTEGVKSNFFNQKAFTTTIPAQFVKKFGCKIVPVYIERKNSLDFKITFSRPISFGKDETIEKITDDLNYLLEKMILRNPGQWIWSHNRWKL